MTSRNEIPTIARMDKINAAKRAIKQAGGQAKLASDIAQAMPGITADRALWRVQKWAYNGVPPKFALIVERFSGVPRGDLCPEVYPVDAA